MARSGHPLGAEGVFLRRNPGETTLARYPPAHAPRAGCAGGPLLALLASGSRPDVPGQHRLPTGSATRKIAPCGSFGVAHSRPPCVSMIERVLDRPIPMPVRLGGEEGAEQLIQVIRENERPAPRQCDEACFCLQSGRPRPLQDHRRNQSSKSPAFGPVVPMSSGVTDVSGRTIRAGKRLRPSARSFPAYPRL